MKLQSMPETYVYLLKWGPGAGCSPSPFTRATFRPTDSILANLLGGQARDKRPTVLWSATIGADATENQEWDTIIVLRFPDGCPMQPADFAKDVAQDRLSLRLQLGNSLPGAKAEMSRL